MSLIRGLSVFTIAFLVITLLHLKALGQFSSPEQVSSPTDYIAVVDQLDIDDMRSAMQKIWMQGLNPRSYWSDDFEWAYQKGDEREFKSHVNQKFLQMLQDLYGGSVDPQLLGFDVKLTKKDFLSVKQLQILVLASGKNADLLIEAVAPQNPPYLSVKEAFKKVYPACADGSWVLLKPLKKVLKLNVRDEAIVDLKRRLVFLGYKITNQDNLFDQDVQSAITDIQWNLRLKPDGVLSPGGKTWMSLNVSCIDRLRQLQADMEKMRWFPQYFEDRFVVINLAMTYFTLIDRTSQPPISMSFRTINGRPARKSPTMRDEIVRVIFNPFWIVPPTIFLQDKVAEIVNLSPEQIVIYFRSHNYEVWNRGFTQRLDPASIDWVGISEGTVATDIFIRQRPSLNNALGVIKFELTNSFSIYMHDTNQRELFNMPQRQLSSGCIRLERPFDLAEYLLKGTPWTRAAIEAVVAKPGQVLNKSTEVNLDKSKRVPVYLTYLTSQMNSDGVIRFVDDSYGQNALIQRFIVGPF